MSAPGARRATLLRPLAIASCALSIAAAGDATAARAPVVARAQAPVRAQSWPEAPAPERVQFVRVLTPALAGGRPSRFRRLLDLVTGGTTGTPGMMQPYGIAIDDAGRVLVADTAASVLHAFDVRQSKYSSIRVAARSLIGVAAWGDQVCVTDSGGPAVTCLDRRGRRQWALGARAGFLRPAGLVADGDRLHVVDTRAHRVVTVGRAGTVLGAFGSHGSEPGQFNFPTNIARAPDGTLYVSDSMNFRVQQFSRDGRYLGGFGQLGDGSGDFNRPKGVALDSDGHVYIVEGLADVVQIFDASGRFLLAVGESGAGEGQFWLPTGIAIADDVIYVADTANRRVQVFKYLKEPR